MSRRQYPKKEVTRWNRTSEDEANHELPNAMSHPTAARRKSSTLRDHASWQGLKEKRQKRLIIVIRTSATVEE